MRRNTNDVQVTQMTHFIKYKIMVRFSNTLILTGALYRFDVKNNNES